MTDYSAKQIWAMDKDHFIHPYTDFATYHEEGAQVITASTGAYVTDAEGKQYIDGIAGLWCVNIGHGREEMAQTIAEQTLQMAYYNPFGHCTNVPGAKLAAKLAELAPGDLNHVFYTCGGSTAVDSAVRLVHYYNNLRGKPNKKHIIARNDAYHGSTYVSANLTGIHATKYSFDKVAKDWVSHVSAANLYRRPKGAQDLSEAQYTQFLADELENRIIALGQDNVAAFIAEPVMGAGGVLVAPKGYHRAISEVCQRYDVLYIADEVVTGFGRLGHFFASQAIYDMQPDIIITAKGISSGYIPLGAALISERIYKVINQPQCEGGVLSMGFTYSGHPVACAAALKNIEIMERENLCDTVRDTGPYFQQKLQQLLDLAIVGDCRGSHLMAGIELVSDKTEKTPFDGSVDIAKRVFDHCKARGLIVRPIGNIVVLSPPLTITLAQIDELIAILGSGIAATIDDLKQQDLF